VGRRSSPRLAGPHFTFAIADLARPDMLERTLDGVFTAIAARSPAHLCLINNAATLDGIGVLGQLGAASIAGSLGVNLAAPAIVADCFCRIFVDPHCDRRIINVSSGAAQSPIAGASLYSIAKAGLEMLTHSLAAEYPEGSLRAITLRPGIIDTPMQAELRRQPPERLPSVDMFRDFHASARLVAPDDVATRVVARLVEGEIENGRSYTLAEL
ncbi:MAG: SDR family NAD(P)-dependent oxidoreductase, partial [Casimicrobiaceae bacterium]